MPIAHTTPSESTPMQKEHVPYPEPRGDFQLRLTGLQIDDDDDDEQGDNGIFGLMRQAQDNIDQALGLDGDLKLKSFDMLSVASDANVQMNESKLAEKLEKEKSKRKYCEEKILELQKQLIQVEEKNHALKGNCSRKNLALRQVNQLLASNKHELDKYRATKMASIN